LKNLVRHLLVDQLSSSCIGNESIFPHPLPGFVKKSQAVTVPHLSVIQQ
jgi:hypothetical protein